MKRKIISVLLVCTMLITAVVGCGGSNSSSSDSSDDEGGGGSSSSTKTLTILASQDWIYDAEKELGKQFEEETGIAVDYQIVPADQYYNVLMTKLNSGEGPDIFGGQSGSFDLVSQYQIEDNAVDLSNEPWIEYYDEFAKEQTSVDGKVYGATFFDTTTDFYIVYNKKIFEEYNLEIPTTYDEFDKVCSELLSAGVTPFYEPMGDGWHQGMWFCEIGGKYEDLMPGITDQLNNNEIKFAEVEMFETVLDQVQDMANKGYFGDNYLSDEYADLEISLGSGEFAMSACKPGTLAAIAEASGGTYEESDFGLFLYTTLDNDVLNEHPCGPSRFIYSGSDNIDAAKQYLEFITTKDSVQHMIDNESKIENLPYELGQDPAYSEDTQEFLETQEKRGVVFQDVIKYLNPQWMELCQDMVSMLIGDMTSVEVLQKVDERRETQAQAAGDEAWQ
ncbi:MAG: ABC transporter substrate-binding protein [Suipraeoptans sp.]